MDNPCLRCGACCAWYRVSFYWSEAEAFLGGPVPASLVVQLNPWLCCMAGTCSSAPRCMALCGEVGVAVSCSIYDARPSPCRELLPWEADGRPSSGCTRARAAHGLPPLPAQDDPARPPLPLSA